jgi:hypothetical protein
LFRLVFESHDGRAPRAESEEKHEPVSDIDTAVVDSLKVLDLKRPIREEADISICDVSGVFTVYLECTAIKAMVSAGWC